MNLVRVDLGSHSLQLNDCLVIRHRQAHSWLKRNCSLSEECQGLNAYISYPESLFLDQWVDE